MSENLEIEISELKKIMERELGAMHNQLSSIYDGMITIGALADKSWLGFAFTINYILLGLILWRVW